MRIGSLNVIYGNKYTFFFFFFFLGGGVIISIMGTRSLVNSYDSTKNSVLASNLEHISNHVKFGTTG